MLDVGVTFRPIAGKACHFQQVLIYANSAFYPCLKKPSAVTSAVDASKRGQDMSELEVVTVTPRQREVVMLIALGRSAGEIADNLQISVRTVRAHTDTLRMRLDVPKARMIPSAYRAATGDDPWVM